MADKVPTKVVYGADRNKGIFFNKEGELVSKGAVIAAPTMNRQCELKEDFLGDVIDDSWSAASGTDAAAADAVVVAGRATGAARLVSGATAVVAESLSSLTHGLNWKAAFGGLSFEARITPVSSVGNVSYFVGFTDVLATTTLEEPITLSGTTFTTNATDAVGFLFDTAATTDVWYGMAVKNDVDATSVQTTSAPVSGTAQVLRIDINKDGDAYLFIDGVGVGFIEDAVSTGPTLTPIVSIMSRTTASRTLDVDYINVRMDRY